MPQNIDPLWEEEKNPVEGWWDTSSHIEAQEESFETLLEKAEIVPEMQENNAWEKDSSSHHIYDTLKKLEDILTLLVEKKSDFMLIQPQENTVWVSMRKDGAEQESFEISYAVYNNTLFAAKKQAWLLLEENTVEQEGKGKIELGKYEYFLAVKTAPSKYGEKIWLKLKKNDNADKVIKKTSPTAILSFIGAIFFVGLVLGASFISFVILNAQTLDDVRFFATLGINLSEINAFIGTIVTVVFSILTFLLSILLSFLLFKFYFTKKIYKRKKLGYALASTLLLFLTFGSVSAWMYLDAKVQALPNWQEQLYGDLKISYNDLRVSPDFSSDEALLIRNTNIIWPVELHFDLSNYQNRMLRQNITIDRYLWSIGAISEETLTPELIQTLTSVWNYEISVEAIGRDIVGAEYRENIASLPTLSISETIEIEETSVPTWGKRYSFDASALSSLGQIEWYFKSPSYSEDQRFPDWEKKGDQLVFFPSEIFFEPIYIGVGIKTGSEDARLEKIIVLEPQGNSSIEAQIEAVQSFENELSFRLQVINAETGFGDGFIESFLWKVEEREYKVEQDIDTPSSSQAITHTFRNYGDQRVEVILRDTRGNELTLVENITIQKQMNLSETLEIIDETTWRAVENIRYNPRSYEYFVDDLWVPTTLRFDARNVRPENILYRLTDVAWDIWEDGNIDGRGMQFEYDIPTPWNHTLAIRYSFQHRRNSEDIIEIVEKVYIWSLRKEAIISLKIETDTQYAPATVSFDASQSFIRDDDIVKFIYDYGNGVVEERDAINPGHRYREAWEYTITLTAVGSKWGRYTTQERLILLPTPQQLQVDSSMKRAPVWQGIDFSSAGSQGQIAEYFWDFGDGNISTDPNPSHSYQRAWNYTVTLQANFTNFNTRSASIEVEIYD